MAIADQYYTCNKCSFKTTLFSKIDDHLLLHTDPAAKQPNFDCFDRLKLLKCPSCEFSTESLILLRYHLVCNHDQQQFALKTKLKTCEKCGFCTHSNYLLIRHPVYSTCKSKNLSKEKKKKVTVLRKNDGKWYLCEKCDYRTTYSSDLKKHVTYKHTPLDEIEWQQCNKCPENFKTLQGLKKHQKGHVLATAEYTHCPECDYSTLSRYHLQRHFSRKHTPFEEIKWVECNKCEAKFKDKDMLKQHLVRLHASNRIQYKCDQCPFETYHKASLKRHIVSRHLEDDEIHWHKCQHCDYKAKRKYHITYHIQSVHSESQKLLQCGHCSFKSKTDSNLRFHILRNHDESAFKCDLCDYRAKCEKTVEIHKKKKHNKHEIVQTLEECSV